MKTKGINGYTFGVSSFPPAQEANPVTFPCFVSSRTIQ